MDNKLPIKSTPTTTASFSCNCLIQVPPFSGDDKWNHSEMMKLTSSQLVECLATTLDHSIDYLSSQDSRQHILEQSCYPSGTHSVPLGNDAESITQCTTVARKPIAMPNLTSPVVVSPLISTHVIQTSLLLHTIDHGLIPCSTCLCINLELSCSTRREKGYYLVEPCTSST